MPASDLPKFVELPKGLVAEMGLADGERPRISYLSLANDVARVQQFWAKGQGDPRSQKATYAGMFFELVEALGGQGLLYSRYSTEPPAGQPVRIARFDGASGRGAHKTLIAGIIDEIARFRPHLLLVSPSVSADIIPKAAAICPVVYYAHSLFWPKAWDRPEATLKERSKRRLRILRTRHKLKQVKGVIASSPLCLEQFRRMSGRDVPHELCERQFIWPVKPVQPRAARDLLYVGGLDDFSGAEMVVAAFTALRRHQPRATLHLIGDGPRAAEFATLATRVPGVQVTVGYDARAQIQAVRAAGLLVVPEPRDTLNGTASFLPEALVYGVPALVSSSTPVGAAEEKGCLTFRAGDSDDLLAKLRLLNADHLAYSRLTENLPLDPAPYFDRSQSWGSAIARMLAIL